MRLFLTVSCMFLFLFSQAQNKQLLYNVNGLPQTLLLNPGAKISFDRHLGLPLFSHIHIAAGSSGANVYDIFGNSGEDINQRVTNTIRRLHHKDYFTANEQWELLSLGWRLGSDKYISTGIYQEIDIFSYFPKDPAILANEGNRDYINIPFDFSHVSFTGEMSTVYHVGLNWELNRRLTVGGRVKFYSGIFNAESTNNTGTFLTESTPGGPNYYRHYADNLDVRVNTSGFVSLRDNTETIQEASRELIGRAFFGGNIGLGGDIGATYEIRPHIKVSGSILDLGFMWQREDVENYTYKGTYQTDGLEPLFPETGPNGETIPYWDIFEDEVDRNLVDETLNESYITLRPIKINAAAEWDFGEFVLPCDYRVKESRRTHSKLGIHLFGIIRPKDIKYAFTTYYDRKLTSSTRMKITYTLDDFSYTNVGLLFSTQLKGFNFYVAADNLIGYFNLAKSHYQSVQLGFQYIILKK